MIKKIKLVFDTAISTPFFIVYAILGLILVGLIIFDIKKYKKISRILYIVCIIFLATFFIIKYFDVIIKVIDSFVEILLKTLYFPNLGIYITILIITNLTFVFTTISEKSYKIYKVISSLITTLIDLLFIMIIGIISKNHIDISSDVKLYSDSTILTLLQISMGLFVSLYLLLMLARIHWRLKLYDKNVTFDNEVYPDMGLYIKNNSTDGKISDEYISSKASELNLSEYYSNLFIDKINQNLKVKEDVNTLKEIVSEYDKWLDDINNVFAFLNTNKDNWKISGNNVMFTNVKLVSQYISLISDLSKQESVLNIKLKSLKTN